MLDGVFSYCSWLENDIASNIIDFVDRHKYTYIPRWKVDNFLDEYNINYNELPQYLKDKLDEIDVYWGAIACNLLIVWQRTIKKLCGNGALIMRM